jgi:hypothetical protein
MSDVWGKLWDLATGEPGGDATIIVDPEDSGRVVLAWPDGSKTAVYWHDNDWQIAGSADGAPCDVAARDAL